MANLIGSLRLISTFDWSEFFESVSLVEQVLQRDPAGIYGRMDFRSRDRYRHAVEELAEPTGEGQLRVALKSVERARQVAERTPDARGAHVGYYLIGSGRRQFEHGIGWSPGLRQRIRRLFFRHATPGYLGTIARGNRAAGRGGARLCLCARVARGDAGVGRAADARARQRADDPDPAADDQPPDSAAAAAAARARSRAGRGAHDGDRADDPRQRGARPGTDRAPRSAGARQPRPAHPLRHPERLRDAPAETLPRDGEILAAARGRHRGAQREARRRTATARFFLFHRTRQWNEQEGLWMGWERKRGKIEEFNRLLRGATDTSFVLHVGDMSDPAAGAVLHHARQRHAPAPRCRAAADRHHHASAESARRSTPRSGRVTDGYGILQPRVSVTFTSAAGSLFARLYSGHTGVDPYTTAVSDTYQDLFGEGIFTGKGLYDVDAFMAALEDCVPENALLSHDLFEGLHARVALVSDVELVDEYPSSVLTHARRQHRWIRGDWQILFWLFPFVPSRHGLKRNPLPLIAPLEDPRQSAPQPGHADAARAARRRLDRPARAALVLDDWRCSPFSRRSSCRCSRGCSPGPGKAQSFPVFWRNLRDDAATALAQVLLSLTFLAYHAWETVHAIGLTLVRLAVTKRRLLEWETAAAATARAAGLVGRRGLFRFSPT